MNDRVEWKGGWCLSRSLSSGDISEPSYSRGMDHEDDVRCLKTTLQREIGMES